MGTTLMAETNLITVHVSLNVIIPTVTPINEYFNITGAYVYSLDQFVNTIPCACTLQISDLTTSILDENGLLLAQTQGQTDDLVLTSDSSQIDIQFPNHCKHKMEYTMKMSYSFS